MAETRQKAPARKPADAVVADEDAPDPEKIREDRRERRAERLENSFAVLDVPNRLFELLVEDKKIAERHVHRIYSKAPERNGDVFLVSMKVEEVRSPDDLDDE